MHSTDETQKDFLINLSRRLDSVIRAEESPVDNPDAKKSNLDIICGIMKTLRYLDKSDQNADENLS